MASAVKLTFPHFADFDVPDWFAQFEDVTNHPSNYA